VLAVGLVGSNKHSLEKAKPVHIAIFMDQHPRSLGGIQTSVMLQKKYLERAGHRVTIVAPNSVKNRATDGFWLLPSWPLDLRGDFGFVANVRRSRKRLDRGYEELQHKFDVVHIQGDMWGGIIGLCFAQRHRLPIVQTMHFNMSEVVKVVLGKRLTRFLFWLLSRELLKHVNRPREGTVGDPWNYLHLLAEESSIVFAPSHHFAKDLTDHKVAKKVEVMHNGVDDDIVRSILKSANDAAAASGAKRSTGKPSSSVRIVWAGRLQSEKRPLEFIRAVADSQIDAQVDIYGKGILFKKVKRLIEELGLADRVRLRGAVPYAKILRVYAEADVLAQTSVGFETQGMTVYEAAAVGTPSVLCDHNIAAEFAAGSHWVVADDSVSTLAQTLKQAVDDIARGDQRGKKLFDEDHLLQSDATAKMIKYYESVIKHSNAAKY
jgi:glycosyltransferase involved in cell wall biosynthesis